jgi:hypothetical protein
MTLRRNRVRSRAHLAVLCTAALLAASAICACGGSGGSSTVTPPSSAAPQTYFAAAVSGAYAGSSISDSEYLSTYTVDDVKQTFAQSIYTFGSGNQKGPQLDYSGTSAALSRGLAEFNISYSNSSYGSAVNNGNGITYTPPLGGNWFFELPDQAGGIVSLKGMPFVPVVAARTCAFGAQAAAYQFVSIPTYIGPNQAGFTGGIQNWNQDSDTAYGFVQVSGTGNTVNFKSIQQFTAAGEKVSSYPDLQGNPPAVTSESGACSPTFYGDTISVPGQVSITNPGVGEIISAPAVVGIGPSGLLLENNGQTSSLVSNASLSGYQPILGSGTGAMGMPEPSSQIDPSALSGAQFVGIAYGGGSNTTDWTSVLTSFGFPSAPANCPSGKFQSPLLGGDFPGNDPTQSPQGGQKGYGNCNLLIDLGKADSSHKGLFSHATVYLGSGFAGSQSNASHSFSATVIAGQLKGKYAVFAVGVDSTGSPQQAWGIYLFQSN